MVTSKEDILCEQAKFYYYDLLFQESNRIIPEFITNHFKQCQHCQKQIHKLNKALNRAESVNGLEQAKSASEISNILKLHFAYLDQPINCEITKPFLPSLLDPVSTIRIPTPITVHLDHCEECVKDLDTINNLELNRAQLYRLSQLFSEKHIQDNSCCKQAQASIMAFVFMAFREIDKETLKHLCVCPDCRSALFQFREAIKGESLSKKVDEKCSLFDQISGDEKFDCVVPYGLDLANSKNIIIRHSLIQHIRRCPTCLTKIQELHKNIYGISERPESGIVTIYKTTGSGQTQHIGRFKDLYAGYPINVELVGRRDSVLIEKKDAIINFTAALKQKILNTKVAAGFVAAIILIAFTLSLNTSSVRAITLAQIFSNFENSKNVHISSFSARKTEPIQEQWISSSLNFQIYKTGDELVLWDINNKNMVMTNLGSELYESRPLTKDQIIDFRFFLRDALGPVSFHDMKNLPANAQWKQITDKNSQSVLENTEEYELKWIQENYNIFIHNKMKVFTDSTTDLPLKIEYYRKISADEKYELSNVFIFEYLDDAKMSKVKEEYF